MIPKFNIQRISESIQLGLVENQATLSRIAATSLSSVPADSVGVGKPIIYFHGGVGQMEGAAKALIDEGKPIGLVASMVKDSLKSYIKHSRPMVFIDTGAFSEMTSDHTIDWDTIYDQMPLFELGNRAYVVLPDKIDDVEETFRRAFDNKDKIFNMKRLGVNFLLPIQSESDPVGFVQSYFKQIISYPDDFLPQTIPAIPKIFIQRDKQNVVEMIQKLTNYGFSRIHLLGVGVRGAEFFSSRFPDVQFYSDSVWTRGKNISQPLSRYARSRIQSLATTKPTCIVSQDVNTTMIDLSVVRKLKKLEMFKKLDWYDIFKSFKMNREARSALGMRFEHPLPFSTIDEPEYLALIMESGRPYAMYSAFDEEDKVLIKFWYAFDEDIIQTLPRLEGISKSGRKTGLSSYTASYQAVRKQVNDLEADIANNMINFEGEQVRLGDLRNQLAKDLEFCKLIGLDGLDRSDRLNAVRNMVTFIFTTAFPFGMTEHAHIFRKGKWSRGALVTHVDTIMKPTFDIENFADKEFYYSILMAHTTQNPQLEALKLILQQAGRI